MSGFELSPEAEGDVFEIRALSSLESRPLE